MCCGEVHNHEYGTLDIEKQEIEQDRIDRQEQTGKDDRFDYEIALAEIAIEDYDRFNYQQQSNEQEQQNEQI